jgi:hypothetical protein
MVYMLNCHSENGEANKGGLAGRSSKSEGGRAKAVPERGLPSTCRDAGLPPPHTRISPGFADQNHPFVSHASPPFQGRVNQAQIKVD